MNNQEKKMRALQAALLSAPTEEGMRRYVETNGTYESEPCTCTKACRAPCKGECGCEACHSAYQDFLSLE